MSNALPLLLAAGAAVLVLGGKKKSGAKKGGRAAPGAGGRTFTPGGGGSPGVGGQKTSIKHGVPPKQAEKGTKGAAGSGYAGIDRERIRWIQNALTTLGYGQRMDKRFDPPQPTETLSGDSRYDEDTKIAVMAFQMGPHGLGLAHDGKPGANTQNAISAALIQRGIDGIHDALKFDECDVSDESTWGDFTACHYKDGKWRRFNDPDLECDPGTDWGWNCKNKNDVWIRKPGAPPVVRG